MINPTALFCFVALLLDLQFWQGEANWCNNIGLQREIPGTFTGGSKNCDTIEQRHVSSGTRGFFTGHNTSCTSGIFVPKHRPSDTQSVVVIRFGCCAPKQLTKVRNILTTRERNLCSVQRYDYGCLVYMIRGTPEQCISALRRPDLKCKFIILNDATLMEIGFSNSNDVRFNISYTLLKCRSWTEKPTVLPGGRSLTQANPISTKTKSTTRPTQARVSHVADVAAATGPAPKRGLKEALGGDDSNGGKKDRKYEESTVEPGKSGSVADSQQPTTASSQTTEPRSRQSSIVLPIVLTCSVVLSAGVAVCLGYAYHKNRKRGKHHKRETPTETTCSHSTIPHYDTHIHINSSKSVYENYERNPIPAYESGYIDPPTATTRNPQVEPVSHSSPHRLNLSLASPRNDLYYEQPYEPTNEGYLTPIGNETVN